MSAFLYSHSQLFWSFTLLIVWFLGEIGQHFTKVPKISFYILFGFIFAKYQIGLLPNIGDSDVIFLVNIISGLILFEFGYRINLRWLYNNPIIIVTSIVEAIATFIVIFILSRWFGIATLVSLEFASLFMATSPFVIICIINQEQSSGQVTERILHIAALNCIFAIFVFKFILGMMVFNTSGSLSQAVFTSFAMIGLSILLGAFFAIILAIIMKYIRVITYDRTIAFAATIIVMVTLAKALSISPVIAALTFGLISRHKKTAMAKTQRNFGALGDLLIVLLFIVVPLNIGGYSSVTWIGFAMAIFLARLLTKVGVISLFSRYSGISTYKGALTGLALAPISIFSVLLLDQSEFIKLALNKDVMNISLLIIFLEVLGPIFTKFALIKAKETN